MSIRPPGIHVAATIVILGAAIACSSSKSKGPTTAPAAAEVATKKGAKVYEHPSAHFRLQYPGDWVPQKDPDYVLALVPPGATSDDKSCRVTVDVPSLPPHLPGMITMGKVKEGYIDDLKKRLQSMKVTEDAEQQVPKAKAQRVVVTGHENGKERTIPALLLIHSDRVYIIRADCETKGIAHAKTAWEQMISTLQWTK